MSYLENTYGMVEVQGQLLEMLRRLDEVCRRHGIEYSLLGGTMLGAVRDGGFIPWDDDVDLVFTREALNAFARVFNAESAEYAVTFDETWVARVVPRQPINGQRPFLDLFHYEPITASPLGRRFKVLLLHLLQGMLKEDADYSRFSRASRALLRTTHALGRLFSKRTKLRMYRWVSAHVACGDGAFVHVPDEQFSCVGLVYPAEYTKTYRDIAFEDATFRVATHAHQMLRLQYGDYMTPPPELERVSKHDRQRGG